jgi:hypothetical protein
VSWEAIDEADRRVFKTRRWHPYFPCCPFDALPRSFLLAFFVAMLFPAAVSCFGFPAHCRSLLPVCPQVLSPDLLSVEFNAAVKALRLRMCGQLAEGPRTWGGQPLTGPKLAQLVPLVADALNRDGLVT